MHARAISLGDGVPRLSFVVPQNSGLSAADAQAAIDAGLDPAQVLTDVHVGASGGVQAAKHLIDNPPVPGFNAGVANLETNAGTHDHKRGLDEASDLIEWLEVQADAALARRLYGRTASFCTGSASQFDQWRQGIAFFLPNMTWLQPPGHVHAMFASSPAPTLLDSALEPAHAPATAEGTPRGATAAASPSGASPLRAVSMLTADAASLVVYVVNPSNASQTLSVQVSGGALDSSAPVRLSVLSSDDLAGFNTPAQPEKIAPVAAIAAASASGVTIPLPAYSFVAAVATLAGAAAKQHA